MNSNPIAFVVEEGSIKTTDMLKSFLKEADLPVEDFEGMKHFYFWTISLSGKIIGFAGVEQFGAAGLLRSVVIRPEFRNREAGKFLVESVERACANRGINSLYLLTETAERFFDRNGYTKTTRDLVGPAVKQSKEFVSSCPASAVVMVKMLSKN